MRKLLLILPIMILVFSCSDSSSVDNSLMIFEVTTVLNLSIEEFANNFKGTYYPNSITLIDYEPESEFSGTVNLNIIGTQSISGNCNDVPECFLMAELDSTYFPFEFVVFTHLILDNSQMRGQFAAGGSTLDTISFEFIALRTN